MALKPCIVNVPQSKSTYCIGHSCPVNVRIGQALNKTHVKALYPKPTALHRHERPTRHTYIVHAMDGNAAAMPPPATSNTATTVPTWLKLVGFAAATVACCAVAAAFQQSAGGFASMTIAARGVTTEGLRSAIRSAWAGLAAGCLHTLAGADHLAALTPLTIGRSHLKASLMGALWGFGHSTGQLILGLLMVVLKDRFQQLVPALSKWGGTTVGLTLVAIGAVGLFESAFDEQHEVSEAHAIEDLEMTADGVLSATKNNGRSFGLATFATGIVYGLQPDALFVIIPALALPTKLAAAAYILMFVLGTVAAMGAYTGVIGATSAAIQKTNSGLTRKLSGVASLVAIGIGLGVLLSGWGFNVPWFTGGH